MWKIDHPNRFLVEHKYQWNGSEVTFLNAIHSRIGGSWVPVLNKTMRRSMWNKVIAYFWFTKWFRWQQNTTKKIQGTEPKHNQSKMFNFSRSYSTFSASQINSRTRNNLITICTAILFVYLTFAPFCHIAQWNQLIRNDSVLGLILEQIQFSGSMSWLKFVQTTHYDLITHSSEIDFLASQTFIVDFCKTTWTKWKSFVIESRAQ